VCAGVINLTLPLATWLGISAAPGEAAGYGPLGAADSQGLARQLAAHPATRWCLTLTRENGAAAGHGCARPGASGPPTGPAAGSELAAWLSATSPRPLEQRPCAHARASPAYRPPGSLQHVINIRDRTCAFPGCRWPAHRCDLDHTVPHHEGGATCECNLAPLCRRHHRAKQAAGWHLDQPTPGVLVWTLPHGRSYTVRPEPHPT
jgi:hypothetical protein